MSDILWRRALGLNDRSTPERRARFERDLEREVDRINDGKVRQHYAADMAARLQALWGGTPVAPRRGRQWSYLPRPPVARGRFEPGRRNLPRPWELVTPASPELKALTGRGAHRLSNERRERLILMSVVNHPRLLDEFAEAFAELEFSSRELDSLRREIIDIAALEASLDADLLRNHLDRKGFGPLLGRIETQFERLREWFVLPDAAAEDVRTGFRQMVMLHRKSVTLARELKTAEESLAHDPSDENLKVLNEIREQLRSATGEEALIEGFGEASGRPQGPVA